MSRYLFLFPLFPVVLSGQYTCATDHIHQEMHQKQTELYSVQNKETASVFTANHSALYTGQIYEIPVVVHIIESTSNPNLRITDEEVKRWLDITNKIYDTTYGNGYYPEGDGVEGGTKMPFRLVLAQRDKDCRPTTGIMRYNGSHLEYYDTWGVMIGLRDLKPKITIHQEHIRNLAPHWPEDLYYNIYIVVGIDGSLKEGQGTGGAASYPHVGNGSYDAFVKASVVKQADNFIMAHEFGHATGLIHPFDGARRDDGCGINNNCNEDNDKVCDTEPISGQISYPTPTNNDINPCTGENYKSTQYNIMNYSYNPRKFTIGQRERALNQFLTYRAKLTQSRAAVPIEEGSNDNVAASQCRARRWFGADSDFKVGIKKVVLGTINNTTSTAGEYADYTTQLCKNKVILTDLPEKEASTMTIEVGSSGNQFAQVWIDYNNDGVFQANERIESRLVSGNNRTFSFSFTPPETAVKNTYLRMRVRGDGYEAKSVCEDLMSGQSEDYAVRIVPQKDNTPNTPSDGASYDYRVGINTDTPQVTLDVREIDVALLPQGYPQGVIFPKFTTAERAAFQNVKAGTMIYNTDRKCLEIYIDEWKCVE